MGVAAADLDGNGFLDIAKTNFSGDLISLLQKRRRPFLHRRRASRAGLNSRQLLGWGVAFLDVDEDGWPDLSRPTATSTPKGDRRPNGSPLVGEHYRQKTLLFHNLGNGHFADITDQRRRSASQLPAPHAVLAVGDLDGDGRPEIVIVNMNHTPSLLKNIVTRRNWLRVTLTGTRSNRSAIGARATLPLGPPAR